MPASPPVQNGTSVVARSALLTLTSTPADHALALRITGTVSHRLITGAGNVSATLDGRPVPLTAEPNGAFLLSTRGRGGGSHSLQLVVAHDGIRELLAGTVSLPHRRSMLESLQGHGMAAWWVLNVAVVLIAVIVISRRR
jgi:hypothetical protein